MQKIKQSVMKKHILILNTGGTISSVRTINGYEPIIGYVAQALDGITALKHQAMPSYDLKEYTPLLDSSNMNHQDWFRIANDIAKLYDQYDGFLIFHGTDTMAYTASALSFMLEHLGKPVILTGSQIPLSEVRNDAVDNIITSMWLLATQPIHEVCVYFNQRLLRGNRTRKINAQGFGAFDSPNYPALARIGIDIDMHHELLRPRPQAAFRLQAIQAHPIVSLRLFPGLMTEILRHLIKTPLKGLVLETYGAGNAPNHPDLLEVLNTACQQSVVVNCTQCQQGMVDMQQYATGNTLYKMGVISGLDITPEAAYCKLLYLFSKYQNTAQVKASFALNLAGEMRES